MKLNFKKIIFGVALATFTFIGANAANRAFASTISLEVTPHSFKPTIEPGTTYSDTFTFRNGGSYDIKYKTSAAPYSYVDKGNGKFESSLTNKNEYSEMVDWVEFTSNSEGILKQGEKIEIGFTITVPRDAPAGGQYVALLVSTDNSSLSQTDSGTSITEEGSLGPIVYAKINGETREDVTIVSNNINGFMFEPPITATTTIKNNGNIHGTAKYILRVYPFFSNESIYNNEELPGEAVIIPNSTRSFTLTWDEAPKIGIYKVESEVKIFDETENAKVSKIVIICPAWVLILIIAFILAVIFWLVARAKQRKQ